MIITHMRIIIHNDRSDRDRDRVRRSLTTIPIADVVVVHNWRPIWSVNTVVNAATTTTTERSLTAPARAV